MKNKLKFEETLNMALVYIYETRKEVVISYEKAEEFFNAINDNDDVNIKTFGSKSKIYIHLIDETGKVYIMIDPNINLNRLKEIYNNYFDNDILLLLNNKNILDIIDLKLENGVLISKENDKFDSAINLVTSNPNDFFTQLVSKLTKEEISYLKLLIKNKSCENCLNNDCLENKDKINICQNWDNKQLIGKQKILSI